MRRLSAEEYLGRKYERLTVTRVFVEGDQTKFECLCECGNVVLSYAYNIKNGHTQSCGCAKITHGHNKVGNRSKLYKIWDAMIQRCTNENSTAFHNYGGRGISICDEWRDFSNFLRDVGEPEGRLELDRIDTNGNYEPGNVRWITHTENNRNKRDNVLYEYKGESRTLMAWSEITGIPYGCIRSRLVRGWTLQRSLTTPPDSRAFNGRNNFRAFLGSRKDD